MAQHSFTVFGAGDFPHAIMSSEGCQPATTDAAAAISAKGYRRVELVGSVPPNTSRWADAGWIVRNFDFELPGEASALEDDSDGCVTDDKRE